MQTTDQTLLSFVAYQSLFRPNRQLFYLCPRHLAFLWAHWSQDNFFSKPTTTVTRLAAASTALQPLLITWCYRPVLIPLIHWYPNYYLEAIKKSFKKLLSGFFLLKDGHFWQKCLFLDHKKWHFRCWPCGWGMNSLQIFMAPWCWICVQWIKFIIVASLDWDVHIVKPVESESPWSQRHLNPFEAKWLQLYCVIGSPNTTYNIWTIFLFP